MSYSTQASDIVFEYIIRCIGEGKWLSGMKIDTEEQLCVSLEVSRVAVRQAVERLSALGVLKKVRGSGTYVNDIKDVSLMGIIYFPPSPETMLKILEFRRMFDPYNAELFTRNASEPERKMLLDNYEEMLKHKDDSEAFQADDIAFHHMLAKGTHNLIISQISLMMNDLSAWNQKYQYDNIGPENAVKWHGRIIEAINDGSPELAALCSKIHIDNSIKYIKDMMNKEKNGRTP